MLQARYPSGWLSVRINFCSIDSKSGSRVRCSDCNYNSEDQTIRSTNHNSFIHISIDRTCCLSVEIRERLCQHTSPFESLQSSLDLILWRLRNGNCILNFVEWWIVHVTKYLTAILVQSHDPTQRVTSISVHDDYEKIDDYLQTIFKLALLSRHPQGFASFITLIFNTSKKIERSSRQSQSSCRWRLQFWTGIY